MLTRSPLRYRTQYAIRRYAVTVLIGPRQCGKTTLAREVAVDRRAEYFDLEDPISQRRLAEPMIALAPLRGLVVIDEVQRGRICFRYFVCWRTAIRFPPGFSSWEARPRSCCGRVRKASPDALR